MAYAQPPPQMDGRSPPDPVHEVSRPAWVGAYTHRPPPFPTSHIHSSASTLPPLDAMDPESSDSDVSTQPDDRYRNASSLTTPIQLTPAPPKHILESTENVEARLRELSYVEDHNVKRLETLRQKRQRKDDRIARKREAQDRRMRAVLDARDRRDARILARRSKEDAAFKAVDDQIEDEEMTLRRRLKRLKRGLPADESTQAGRSISAASMSPPGPAFSTVPPPAKRHQSGPPSQVDGVHTPQQSTLPPPPPPQQHPPSAPSYSFYQSNQKPYPVPYHPGPTYSTFPPALPTPQPGHTLPTGPQERTPYTPNGRPISPAARSLPQSSTIPSQGTPPSNLQSRQPSSTYDTRPPPTTSGFATINAPTASGFAAINPRSAATPPSAHSNLAKAADVDGNRPVTAGPHQDHTPNNAAAYRYNNGSPASNTAASTPATGSKRTPSTTHPYQMSEAFANRHHHCEKVDGLNRGIWTSYGPGGTQDNPTGPPVQMYLRCNHDNCRRIDWRTVHGLQCHIVKNHEQPKGTIGSLEKALDRYGVPVKDVEDYERDHGEGTGGTMADPKNLKIKTKTREAYGRKSTPASFGVDASARPAGYRPSSASFQDGPTTSNSAPRQSSGNIIRRPYGQEETYSDPEEPGPAQGEFRKSGLAPTSGKFEVVRNEWRPSSQYPLAAAKRPVDPNRQLQGDAVMKDAPLPAPSTWKHWSPANPTPDTNAPSGVTSIPETSQTLSNAPPPPVPAPNSSGPVSTPTQTGIPSTQTQVMAEQVKKIEEKQEQADSTFATPNPTESQNADTQMTGVSETQPAQSTAQEAVIDSQKDEPRESDGLAKPSSIANEDVMDVDREKESAKEKVDGIPESTTESKDHISESAVPANSTRSSTLQQSPFISNKPPPTPASAKRLSRRSSAARKLSSDSEDGHTEVTKIPATPVDNDTTEIVEKEKEKDKEKTNTRAVGGGVGVDGDGNNEREDSITVDTSGGAKTRDEDLEKEKEREIRTPPRRMANGRFTRKRTLERGLGGI